MSCNEVDGMARTTAIWFVKIRAAADSGGKLAFHPRISFDEAPHAISEPGGGLKGMARHGNRKQIEREETTISILKKCLLQSVLIEVSLKTKWTCAIWRNVLRVAFDISTIHFFYIMTMYLSIMYIIYTIEKARPCSMQFERNTSGSQACHSTLPNGLRRHLGTVPQDNLWGRWRRHFWSFG